MSDFISRSAVMEVFEAFTFTSEEEKKRVRNVVEHCVNNAPIAYDVEKVVEQLESISSEVFGHSKVLNLDKAIEIVKEGGIDGRVN